jgi:hypothetical protein
LQLLVAPLLEILVPISTNPESSTLSGALEALAVPLDPEDGSLAEALAADTPPLLDAFFLSLEAPLLLAVPELEFSGPFRMTLGFRPNLIKV